MRLALYQVDAFADRPFTGNPVTGSAHCSLAPYWGSRLGRAELSALQVSARGGALRCRLAGDRVRIAGRSRLYLRGEIEV